MPTKKRVTAEEAAKTCLCCKSRMAARALTRTYDRTLRSTGLRITQFTILVAASVAGGVPLSRLADILGLERTTLSRNLSVLERDGLIRVKNVDGRTRNVLITPAGAARLSAALPLWNRAQQEVRQKFGPKKWGILQDDLRKLVEAA
jgi:DNA-binding MarR family transcriptional regulator